MPEGKDLQSVRSPRAVEKERERVFALNLKYKWWATRTRTWDKRIMSPSLTNSPNSPQQSAIVTHLNSNTYFRVVNCELLCRLDWQCPMSVP